MNKPEPKGWADRFDEHVNELRRETHWGTSLDSQNHYFGHKTQRQDDTGFTELFTVTDWGHIKSFIKSVEQQARKEGQLIALTKLLEMRKEMFEDIFETQKFEDYFNSLKNNEQRN